jgi:iron-sulfur cluster repair protein YtfE (RIC family)
MAAADPASRVRALKKLSTLLTGHSIAEEAVLYPALAKADEKGHATKAYTEQSAAKMEMGLLEDLPPMSQEFMDKLEHINGAVAHHVYEEESNWFLELKTKTPEVDQVKLTQRYQEHFARYMGEESDI